ncbi:MAG TPA: LLM class F420-dependent oxidoreductase [Myxococcota bacterium]|jgi:probable F420-dependent oxidoreductase|nr:LLM class F420-dependent oxidoreductase [Myxococcota bacterium]
MTDFGVLMFPTDYAIQPIPLAKAAEERGFESLWFPEHTHIPASRRSPWPGGADLPKEYWHTHDPFVALSAAAAVTTRLKLATGICLVVERDPIQLAKEVASLDVISGGRVLLGIGGGWNAEEMENHGVPFQKRWKIVREKVLAMRAIWTQENAAFHGEFVRFDPIWSWPKPVQKGGPKVILGADSKWAPERVAEYCDGWMPIAVRNPEKLGEGVEALRRACAARGRDFGSLDLSVFGVPPRDEPVEKLIGLGFHRVVFSLPAAPAEEVLPLLDRCAEVARKNA